MVMPTVNTTILTDKAQFTDFIRAYKQLMQTAQSDVGLIALT